jgi:cytochrome c biogenesis protein CcmG/thiol:disulfide interchange protein DsbE
VAVAALIVLAGALTALRARRVGASNRMSASNGAAGLEAVAAGTGAGQSQDDSGDDGTKVIRFASNPTPMPPFLMNDLDGKLISTADLRGKVVLVSFWATWCPPCREEIPMLIDLANRYKDRLQVIGISEDDAPASDVRAFAKRAGINYPILMGGDKMSAEYGGVPALPTLFVVNPDGRIVQKHVGVYSAKVYDNEVRALLGMPVDVKVETFEDVGQIFLKNASNATALPGVDFSGLTPDQKRAALKRMNSEMCTCGCKLTIAQCRISEPDCDTSPKLAAKIIREVKSGKVPPPVASPSPDTAKN